MSRLVVVFAALGLIACAGQPKRVRVSCDRTGSFTFTLPADGAGAFAMPPCDAQCQVCGQECSVTVVE